MHYLLCTSKIFFRRELYNMGIYLPLGRYMYHILLFSTPLLSLYFFLLLIFPLWDISNKGVKSGGMYISSAQDKLLGQLGTYATWLSSIAYLQKQLRIFIFFYATFFFCDYTFSYCMKPSGMCLHIYSLPSSAFLKYQTRGFYCS